MARKRDYAAEYAKRLAKGKAAGKSRQQARGHHKGEAKERRQRERAELGLAHDEIARVRRWATRRASEIHSSFSDPEEIVEAAQTKGYDWFKTYRDEWNAVRRRYLKGEKPIGSITALEGWASSLDVDDISWLYYH